MEKEIKIKSICKYNGHSVKVNKSVDLSLKFNYDELVNYIQSLQMLNEDVTVKVKIADQQGSEVGTFRIKELKIDGDGEATLKLVSQMDFVDPASLTSLIVGEAFNIMLIAKIEIEEEEPTEDEESWDEE